jgi:8-oxo-dGTP pyrophosphatase MutT (NUDIX family)
MLQKVIASESDDLRKFVTERIQLGASDGPVSDYDLNPSMRVDAPPNLTAAAVLIPLVLHDDGATMLLTLRTDHLRDHAGQVSFPGGRVEECDVDALDCALRETEEEVGLDRSFIDVIGTLDTYETRTGFSITPVVGLVRPGFTLTLDPGEVAEAFEVPLTFVMDPENHERHSRMWKGAMRYFYMLPFEDRYIWGATAGMIINLYQALAK